MIKFLFKLIVFIFCCVPSLNILAQENGKTITMVVTGEASTKNDAIKQALRSAVEQAFGVFVSANTEVLNDDVIKDEIVTISTGNISDYKEINSLKNNDGSYFVTVEATVSIGNLTNFAKSKGLKAELATGAFAMNMKIRELNKQNEIQAIADLQVKLLNMSFDYNFFDYNLELSEPYLVKDGYYGLKAKITITPNINLANFRNAIISTLKSLSLSKSEQEEYAKANIPFVQLDITEYNSDEDFLNSIQKAQIYRENDFTISRIALRNTDKGYPYLYFPTLLYINELKIALEDNTKNYFRVMYWVDKHNGQRRRPGDIAHVWTPVWPLYEFNPKYRNNNVVWYTFGLRSKNMVGTVEWSKLFNLDERFDFNFKIGHGGGGSYLKGPGEIEMELIYPKDHFEKITDIELKFKEPFCLE